jgi:hypothetical protein
MAERIGDIMNETVAFRERIKSWGNIGSPRTDGSAEDSKADELRLFAVGEYHLRHDIATFRANLAEAATLYIGLFERSSGALPVEDVVTEVSVDALFAPQEPAGDAAADGPDDVAPWLLTMVTYKELFNALASGDRAVAERLAALMGGHLDPDQPYDQPLDHYLGWALKYMVDDAPEAVRRDWIGRLEGYVRAKQPTLIGYPLVMRAILDGDLAAAQAGFAELLKGHRKESRKDKLFGDTEDEIVCVWGLGLANLARWRGLPFDPRDKLIPSDLLV